MKISRVLFLSALALAALLWHGGTPASAAAQATFTVNSTSDTPDAQPGNGICETGIGNGVCSLRAAIMEANVYPGADILLLPAGTYTLTRAGQDNTALNGDLDIWDSLGIYGAGALSTTINGNGVETHDRVLEIVNGVAVSIFDVYITGGVAPVSGGGIFSFGWVSLTNTNVSFNSAHDYGGGISNQGLLQLTNSDVSANVARRGGGISSGDELILIGSSISGNYAKEHGGGLFDDEEKSWLINTTISGNRADLRGGGIYSFDSTVHLNNVTLVSNVADDDNNDAFDGGGIVSDSSVVFVSNSIIANNIHRSSSTPLPLPDDCKGTLDSDDYNLIETLTGCTVNGSTTHNITGQDPQLGPLQNNGGATQTHALNANSPAIDAGNPSGCEDINGGTLTTDQRGAPRHFDGDGNGSKRCDMGSVEYGGRPTYPTPTATKTPTNSPPTATNPPSTATKTPTNLPVVTATHTPTFSGACATKPGKPSLLAPPNNTTTDKLKVKLDWNDVPCATKYKVKVKQDAKKGTVVDAKKVTKSKHKTVALQIGHIHFWFVKVCNEHGCTKSETHAFTVKP